MVSMTLPLISLPPRRAAPQHLPDRRIRLLEKIISLPPRRAAPQHRCRSAASRTGCGYLASAPASRAATPCLARAYIPDLISISLPPRRAGPQHPIGSSISMMHTRRSRFRPGEPGRNTKTRADIEAAFNVSRFRPGEPGRNTLVRKCPWLTASTLSRFRPGEPGRNTLQDGGIDDPTIFQSRFRPGEPGRNTSPPWSVP